MAVRIAGVILNNEKRIEAALPAIFGIGPTNTLKILKAAGINPDTRTKNLSEKETEKLREIIEKNYKVENELKIELSQNIRLLKDIGSYRGSRHSRNLPVHGQRTRTNARTKRGKRVSVGSGRRKSAEKT